MLNEDLREKIRIVENDKRLLYLENVKLEKNIKILNKEIKRLEKIIDSLDSSTQLNIYDMEDF